MNERVVPPAAADTQPMQRLADKLTALIPPSAASPFIAAELPKPSPAVTAALEKSAGLAAEAKRKAARRARPLSTRLVEAFVTLCGFMPYALVALALRVVMARVFFLDGQAKVLGPQVAVELYGFDFSVILPTQIKAGVLGAYGVLAASLPVSPTLVAYTVCYAAFILPIMLVLGFGTRFAALALLGLTVFFDLYVTPQALWSAHVYWGAILLVLISLGPGAISIDQILRMSRR